MTKNWCDNWTDKDLKALSDWDQKLIVAARKGEWLESGITEDAKKPVLTPRLIVSLATGQHDQDWTLHPEGIMVEGFRFDNFLDFSNRHINTGLYFHNCLFQENCYFNDGRYRNLSFSHSTFQNPLSLWSTKIEDSLFLAGATLEGQDETGVCLKADRLTIGGTAFLRHGFKATGTIRLLGAKIAGDLDMEGAELKSGSNGRCLHADGLIVGGAAFLCNGFKATGAIRLLSAKITDDLDMKGAELSNGSNGNCLNADNITVGGSALLRHGFKATSTIRLLGAKIAGDLSLIGAELSTRSDENNKYCLRADKISIGDNVFLRENFSCYGNLDFPVATIKGSFQIQKAHFSGNLNLRNFTIHQNFIFHEVTTEPNCTIDLRHAYADVLIDDLKSWSNFKVIGLDGFEYNHLYREADGEQHLAWLHKMPQTYTPQPYEQLAKNLKADGHSGHARVVLVEKQRQLLKYGKITGQHKFWLRIIGPLISYGYRPWRVIPVILLMFILGENIFLQASKHNLMVPANPKVAIELKKENTTDLQKIMPTYPSFVPFIYSIDSFLPFVELDQEKYWMPDGKNKSGWGLMTRIYRWFHIAMGWFLSSLLVAGLAGLVKKDD